MERLSVAEAATRLGVTPDAVRQRIRRDTISYEKTEEGRYFVYLTEGDGRHDSVHDALVDRLKDENEWLRREVERKDTIIMSISEGLKTLEAPSETRESPVTSPEDLGQDQAHHEPERLSWWRRLFQA
jgi:hypothetical protein